MDHNRIETRESKSPLLPTMAYRLKSCLLQNGHFVSIFVHALLCRRIARLNDRDPFCGRIDFIAHLKLLVDPYSRHWLTSVQASIKIDVVITHTLPIRLT